MIFNEKYNLIIEFAKENNPEFAEVYDAVVKKIPDAVIQRCQKCRSFEKETRDAEYCLETYPKEGAIELSIDYLDDRSISLYVEDIKEKKLNELAISDIDEKVYEIFDFLALEFSTSKNEIEYAFEIAKTDENHFKLLMEKIVDSVLEKRAVKEFTMSELLSKVDVKNNKR